MDGDGAYCDLCVPKRWFYNPDSVTAGGQLAGGGARAGRAPGAAAVAGGLQRPRHAARVQRVQRLRSSGRVARGWGVGFRVIVMPSRMQRRSHASHATLLALGVDVHVCTRPYLSTGRGARWHGPFPGGRGIPLVGGTYPSAEAEASAPRALAGRDSREDAPASRPLASSRRLAPLRLRDGSEGRAAGGARGHRDPLGLTHPTRAGTMPRLTALLVVALCAPLGAIGDPDGDDLDAREDRRIVGPGVLSMKGRSLQAPDHPEKEVRAEGRVTAHAFVRIRAA
jgi:hypothetical protein